jgi:hypothetical protein
LGGGGSGYFFEISLWNSLFVGMETVNSIIMFKMMCFLFA